MNEKFLILFSEASLLLGASVGIVLVLLGTYYDFLAIRKRRELSAAIARLRGKKQPSVIILVLTCNHESTITACLDSLRGLRYRNYQIVVADNASNDATVTMIRTYQRRHPRLPLRLITQDATLSLTELRKTAFAKLPASDFILLLDGTTTLMSDSLKSAVAELVIRPTTSSLLLRTVRQYPQTVDHLLGRLQNLNVHLLQKSLSASHLLRFETSSPLLERYATFALPYTAKRMTKYASHSIALSSFRDFMPRSSRSTQLFRPSIRQPARFAVFLTLVTVISYSIDTAASLHTGTLLFLSWLLCTLWVAYIVWSDESIRLAEKIELYFSAPSIYFLLYVWSTFFLLKTLAAGAKRIIRAFISSCYKLSKSAKISPHKIDKSRAQ